MAGGALPRSGARSASPPRSPARMLGAWIGAHLSRRAAPSARRRCAAPRVCSAAVARGAGRLRPLHARPSEGVSARVALHDVGGGAGPRGRGDRARSTRPTPPTTPSGSTSPPGRAAASSSTRSKRIGPGVYRTHRADPGLRQLEGDDPPAQGQLADGAADLPAARRGDPGRRSPGPGPLHPRLRRRAQAPAARAEGRQPGCWSRSPTRPSPAIALSLLALLAWALHRLAVGRAARAAAAAPAPAQRPRLPAGRQADDPAARPPQRDRRRCRSSRRRSWSASSSSSTTCASAGTGTRRRREASRESAKVPQEGFRGLAPRSPRRRGRGGWRAAAGSRCRRPRASPAPASA